MTQDEIYMQRAIQLAGLGEGLVSPNPLVGCVIVENDEIIGEGWHKQYGQAHAEVNAIASVEDKSRISKSTVYVNLEPCTHHGKTPPCTELLIQNQVRRVVVSNTDPNPIAGGGIQKLGAANIEASAGILKAEGRMLNRRFFTFMEKKRPYIILKWAETADGFIARENFESKWISNQISRRLVHRWRSEEDAVLVGTATAMYDNPKLNVRDWSGRNPIRIVIDRSLKLDKKLDLFDHAQATLCYNTLQDHATENLILKRLSETDFMNEMMRDLFARNIQSVMVEGGSRTLIGFLENNYWDEARVFKSQQIFGKGIAAPIVRGKITSTSTLQEDLLTIYRRE